MSQHPHAPQQQGGQPYAPPPPGQLVSYQGQPVVQPRNPILFALASFLVAGLGSMLAGRVFRGLLILGAAVVNWVLFLIPVIGLFFVLTGFVITLISVVDGYRSAVRWNARHGVIS